MADDPVRLALGLFRYGAACLVWVAIWLPVYRSPDRARWLTKNEREKVLAERDSAPKAIAGDAVGNRGLLLEVQTLWGVALAQGCINYTSYFFLAWLPGFLQSAYGLSVMQTGAYTAVTFALSTVFSIALSYCCDRLLTTRALYEGKRHYAVGLGALMSGAIVLTPYVGSVQLATVVLTIALTFNTSPSP